MLARWSSSLTPLGTASSSRKCKQNAIHRLSAACPEEVVRSYNGIASQLSFTWRTRNDQSWRDQSLRRHITEQAKVWDTESSGECPVL